RARPRKLQRAPGRRQPSGSRTDREPLMPFWYWLVVAAVFGVIEVAAPAMVCIWFAAAALGVAAIAWISPSLAWEHQALIFAVLAIASVVVGRLAFAPARSPRIDQ